MSTTFTCDENCDSSEDPYGYVACGEPAVITIDGDPGDPEVGPMPDLYSLCDKHWREQWIWNLTESITEFVDRTKFVQDYESGVYS